MTNRDLAKAPHDRLTLFGYEETPERDFPKKSIRLSRTDALTVSVQIINGGGETNMHSHTGRWNTTLAVATPRLRSATERAVVGIGYMTDGGSR